MDRPESMGGGPRDQRGIVPLHGAAAMAALALAAVLVLLGTAVMNDRTQRLDHLRHEAENRSILLAQHVDGVLRQVDSVLATVAFAQETPVPGSAPEALYRHLSLQLPPGGCLTRIGPAGNLLGSTCPWAEDPPLAPEVFAAHAGRRRLVGLSSDPVRGQVMLHRSVIDGDGRFLGVVEAVFPAGLLLGYDRTVGVDQVDALVSPDGGIVAGPSLMFASRSADLATRAAALVTGRQGPSPGIRLVETPDMVVAAFQARTLPLLAVAATPKAPLMKDWQRNLGLGVLVCVITVVGAGLMLAWLYRADRQRMAVLAELKLKDQALAQSTNGIIISKAGTDLPIVYVNPAFETGTGYDAGEVLGRNPRFLHIGAGDQTELQVLRDAIRKGQAARVTLRNFRKDGSLFYNEVTISPVRDAAGQVTHYVGIQHDLTDRILAERALQDRLQFEQTLLDTIPLPVFVKDVNGVYLGANRAFAQATGIPRDRLPGLCVRDVLPAEAAERMEAADQELLRTGGTQVNEMRMRYADGEWHDVIVSRAMFTDSRAQGAGIVGIFNDITEIRRHEAELAELATQRDQERLRAEAASRAKSNFLACMSHELRTPLNAILGFSEIIHTGVFGQNDPRYADYAGDIHDSGEHLLSLINDILDLSRIEAGKLELEPAEVAVEPLVQAVVRLTRQRASDHGHRLTVDMGAAAGRLVRADERAVKQVLFNLLSNAIKFTPDGGHITVSCAIEGPDRLAITVADTGVGIPDDQLALVFQPFERGSSAYVKQREGTGLGLPLVDNLIRAHGGEVRIVSTIGQGTDVTVTLPLVEAAAGLAA